MGSSPTTRIKSTYSNYNITLYYRFKSYYLYNTSIAKRVRQTKKMCFAFRPVVERSKTTDSKSVDPGFESQLDEIQDIYSNIFNSSKGLVKSRKNKCLVDFVGVAERLIAVPC